VPPPGQPLPLRPSALTPALPRHRDCRRGRQRSHQLQHRQLSAVLMLVVLAPALPLLVIHVLVLSLVSVLVLVWKQLSQQQDLRSQPPCRLLQVFLRRQQQQQQQQ
jgi:hypothetical protein